jgi:hypothetical protein
MPDGGAAKLPCNYGMVHMLRTFQQQQPARAQDAHPPCNFSSAVCDEGTPATHHCSSCGEFLCGECNTVHSRGRVTREHTVLSVADELEGGVDAMARIMAVPKVCGVHPGERLKLWCDTCGRPICRDCIVVDHR